MSIEFYIPQQGDTAGTVTDGYASNFEALDTAKADAQTVAEALAGKVDKADGEHLMTSAEREKLSGIEAGANAYTHPESHPADMIADTAGKVIMTSAEREKLSGIEAGANAYTLPAASASALGGIKVGRNLSIDAEGRLSAVGGSGSGDGILVLPHIAPERDADGNLTNSAAFVAAWGGILSEYLAAPDSHALYMDTEAGEGLMIRIPCTFTHMGGEADAVQWLLSGFAVVNIPGPGNSILPCKTIVMAAVVCNAAGEMQSVAMYAGEGIVTADGGPNLLGADDAVIVEIPDNATEDQLKTILQPVVTELQLNPQRQVIVRYGVMLLPAATGITDVDFMIAAINANPLTVSDPDNKWIVRAQVYCRLSNGVIQSAVGDVTGYELATTEAVTSALTGKANVTGDDLQVFKAKNVKAEYIDMTDKGTSNYMYIGRGDKISSAYSATDIAIQNNTPGGTVRLASASDPVYTPVGNPALRHTLWHTGNFDPAAFFKTDVKGWRTETDCDNMLVPGTYDINPNETAFANAPFGMYGQIVVFRTSVAVAQVAFEYASGNMFVRNKYNTTNFSPWRAYWHSGHFDPATKTTLLPYSLDEQLVPGEFWPGFDGVLRQVYIRSFQGSMSALLADKQLLHNVKEVQYVRGGLGEAELFVPPYPQHSSAGSQWGYLVLGNILYIDLQDENWNAAMQYNLTFKYTKA